MRMTFVAAMLLAALPAAASAMDNHMAVQPNALKWGPAPPSLPPGAQVAVLDGDPGKDGPYVLRAKLPSGYKVPPHTHPTDENVTVISGTFHIAMGDKFDATKGDAVKAGGVVGLHELEIVRLEVRVLLCPKRVGDSQLVAIVLRVHLRE